MSPSARRLKALFYVLVLGVGAALIWRQRDALVPLWAAHWDVGMAAIALSALQLLTQARNFWSLLARPGLSFGAHWPHLWGLATLTNYLAPFQPGLAVRAVTLRHWGVPLAQSLATTARQLALSLWAGLWLAGFAALWLTPSWATGTGIALLLGAAGITLARRLGPDRLPAHWQAPRLARQLAALLAPPAAGQLGLIALAYLISALNLWIVYGAFGGTLNAPGALFLAVVLTASGLLALLPANLGMQELLVWYAATLTGLGSADGIAIALLFRAAHLGGGALVLLLTPRRRPEPG